MLIWGKITGFLFGWLLVGPIGALIGLGCGHCFDAGLKKVFTTTAPAQRVFFETTFLVMGHLAKSDGPITPAEIQAARSIMQSEFQLNEAQIQLAIALYSQGKQPQFNLEQTLEKFMTECGRFYPLRNFFLEIMVKVALADGQLHPNEEKLLWQICESIQLSRAELLYHLSAHTAGHRFNNRHQHSYQQQQSSSQYHQASSAIELEAAYKVLGVQPQDDLKTIKTAYRRLMSQHHPDKLMAKGVPTEMLNFAKEKTQQISAAYELIEKRRQASAS